MHATSTAFVNGPVKVRQLMRKATRQPSWKVAQRAPSPCVVIKPQQQQQPESRS
jgi:hypothetical protein